MMNLSKNINKLRREKNLTLKELSNKTGIAQPILSNIERGVNLPTFKHIMKLLLFFKISFADLAKGDL